MKKSIQVLLIATLLLAFLPATVSAQNQKNHELHFKNEVLQPEQNVQAFLDSYSISKEQVFDGRFYKIIQFNEIPLLSERKELENNGVKLLDYIPDFGYFASFKVDFVRDALKTYKAGSIIDITSSIKLAPMLYEESYPDYALRPDGKIELLVSFFGDVNSEKALSSLSSLSIEILQQVDDGEYFQVISSLENIQRIASEAFVNYVEPIYPKPIPENYTGRTLHRSNAIANDFSTGRHYDGTGVSVMLQDDGKIGPHIDLDGRLIEQFLSSYGGDHGDHCAGIIGSAGNLNPHVRGNAFGANLYIYEVSSQYQGFNLISSHYFSKNIRVTSTSYSDGCNAGYTSLARSLDMQIINYPALMHVFSAGNDGTSNCGYGAGSGWGNITGGHKVGKNVMTVANLDYLGNLSSSSSRGPAHDGRIKPDISAKGSDVYSTLPDNTYGYKSGTSMSCPGVSGVMAQLFQAYRDLNGGSDPFGGLLKGIVLNTAEDLGNPGPDFKFGWGRINALRAVQVLEEGRYDSANIENGGTNTHHFEVPENTAQMRVMIYWTDYQGSVNTNWALVNNLDIKVTDPANGEWMPWVLNHYPDADSLNKPAVRGMDERNNMEQVTIDYPDAGLYTLMVEGATVPQGPQKYYIIYEYIPNAIVLTYPFGGESLSPGDEETIRWDAFGTQGTFVLEISMDNGNNWELIKDNISGDKRDYDWTVPTAITGNALIRITNGELVSQNTNSFSIIPTPRNLTIDWACDNALHLSWKEVAGATNYTIYKLGAKYMEPIATTNINSFIVEDINPTEISWYSVSANGPNDAKGLRAIAVVKNAGTYNCNQVDAWLTGVPSVEWGVFQACMDIQALNVTVEVKNFGLEPITDPELSYQLDEGSVITETYIGTILPDSTATFTFADPINISMAGSYNLKTSVVYGPDQNPDNDLLETTLDVIEGEVFRPGNTQTLENFTNCIPAPICELSNCELGESWINLENQVKDEIDWRTWHGTTNTYYTGPTTDHTTGTSDGKYLYLEPSVVCFDRLAILSAPCIDLTDAVSPALDFWYHAYGSDIGRLHIDIFDGSNIIKDVVEPLIGNQGDEWKNMIVDLSEFNGKKIGLRFRGYTGGGDKGDLAIDDISITDVTSIGLNGGVSEKLNIYPNPGNGYINISIDKAESKTYNLKVVDIFGKVMYSSTVTPVNGAVNKVVDLTNLSGGIYFIEMNSENGTYQTKLTIN